MKTKCKAATGSPLKKKGKSLQLCQTAQPSKGKNIENDNLNSNKVCL